MANTFKLKTSGSIGTGSVKLYTVPGSTTTVLIGATLVNTGNTSIGGSLLIESDTTDTEINQNVYLVKEAPIPAGSALEVMSGNKIVLQTTDIVKGQSDASGSMDSLLSIMEIT